jgi:hypothetical protein
VEGATDPESKPKPSSVDWEVELEPEPPLDVDPFALPEWLTRERKATALATTAAFFTPAARRRAASILVGDFVTLQGDQRAVRAT